MPPSANEVSFVLRLTPSGVRQTHFFTVDMTVGPDVYLEMIFQPTTLRSSVCSRVWEDLRGRGLIPPTGRRAMLRDVRLDRQPVPDFEVRLGAAASMLDLDGILGANFLEVFSELHVDLRTWRVRLVP